VIITLYAQLHPDNRKKYYALQYFYFIHTKGFAAESRPSGCAAPVPNSNRLIISIKNAKQKASASFEKALRMVCLLLMIPGSRLPGR
jgi:hypothetical protein